MLKSNSKKARENLQAYILKNWNIEEGEENRTKEETYCIIKAAFIKAAYSTEYEKRESRAAAFTGWLQGLPRCLGDFMLNCAVDTLGDILEETETERKRFTETAAENKLTAMIYNEIFK